MSDLIHLQVENYLRQSYPDPSVKTEAHEEPMLFTHQKQKPPKIKKSDQYRVHEAIKGIFSF